MDCDESGKQVANESKHDIELLDSLISETGIRTIWENIRQKILPACLVFNDRTGKRTRILASSLCRGHRPRCNVIHSALPGYRSVQRRLDRPPMHRQVQVQKLSHLSALGQEGSGARIALDR